MNMNICLINNSISKRGTQEWKDKIGLANRGEWIAFECDVCKKRCEEKISHYKKSKKHFCSRKCQGSYYKNLPFWEASNYKGIRKIGEPKWLYSARYRKTHPERISHLKAVAYARKRNAKGSHTLEEWNELKKRVNYLCVKCFSKKPLTKDHIMPLSKGGTDFISNIQPLCRNCNSQKWSFNIYENPELLSPQTGHKGG